MTCALAFAALGIWQLERRTWKLRLIERVDARVHAPPVPLTKAMWHRVDEYRRVRLTGVFRHDAETMVQALTERGAGFWVLTPLDTRLGTVLVNRGFVTPERRDPRSRAAGLVAGPTTVVGLVRASEPDGGFLRANDPVADRWHSRDIAAISRARGVAAAAPFFVDADATPSPGGWPVGGLTVVRFRNTHLSYALTWFALAGMSAYGAYRIVRARTG